MYYYFIFRRTLHNLGGSFDRIFPFRFHSRGDVETVFVKSSRTCFVASPSIENAKFVVMWLAVTIEILILTPLYRR